MLAWRVGDDFEEFIHSNDIGQKSIANQKGNGKENAVFGSPLRVLTGARLTVLMSSLGSLFSGFEAGKFVSRSTAWRGGFNIDNGKAAIR